MSKLDDLTIGEAKALAAMFGKCDAAKTSAPSAERAVVVTTAHRGVFFGYASDTNADTIKLRNARNILYWPATQKGFIGLGSDGPQMGSRVGPSADIELRNITCVMECSEAAVKAWEAAPWKE